MTYDTLCYKLREMHYLVEQDTLKNIRNKNLSDILQIMRNESACTLSQLTEKTEGGLTTVKKCIHQAMDYGMVIEGDIADSTGGRKAKQYLLNPDYQYFLIFIVDNNNLICRTYNFSFAKVEESNTYFEMNEFLNCVYFNIDCALKKYDVGTICISMPCVIKNGKILDWYYNQSLKGFDLKLKLEEKYKKNIIVQNDMKLTVIGESMHNRKNIKNIVTVQFGHNGIGMGEMVNGHLLEGNSGFAGEVGYVNDIRKNIMGISFPAKVVRNSIIYLNPQIIVFYKSERQNEFKHIFDSAIRGLPDYSIPEFEVSENYSGSIIDGFISLINKYGYFK